MDNLRKLIEYFPTLNTENLLPWNLVNQENTLQMTTAIS